ISDSRPGKIEVHIPPIDRFSNLIGIDIGIAYVDPTDERLISIHDYNLTVVQVNDPIGQGDQFDLVKRHSQHACFPQGRHDFPSDSTASKIIIDQSNDHSLLCFFLENIRNLSPDFIRFVDVIFHMDVMSGRFQNFEDPRKFPLAIEEDLCFIVVGERAQFIVQQQSDQSLILLEYFVSTIEYFVGPPKYSFAKHFFSFGILHQFFGVDFPIPVIDTEGEIQNDSQDRQEYNQEQI